MTRRDEARRRIAGALAVGVALWGRLPTADEVAAWLDADEPAGEEVG